MTWAPSVPMPVPTSSPVRTRRSTPMARVIARCDSMKSVGSPRVGGLTTSADGSSAAGGSPPGRSADAVSDAGPFAEGSDEQSTGAGIWSSHGSVVGRAAEVRCMVSLRRRSPEVPGSEPDALGTPAVPRGGPSPDWLFAQPSSRLPGPGRDSPSCARPRKPCGRAPAVMKGMCFRNWRVRTFRAGARTGRASGTHGPPTGHRIAARCGVQRARRGPPRQRGVSRARSWLHAHPAHRRPLPA